MPTTDCVAPIRLDVHPQRPIDITFDAPRISTDGGLLLLRALEGRLDLCQRIAALLPEPRDRRRVVHARLEQVRQRIFQIALGYEDQSDADRLRLDPLLQVACDRLPDDDRGLSSQPTLSRLEHAVGARDVVRLQRLLEDDYVGSLPAATTVVVLDVDTTDDATYGEQPGSSFHGHYGHWIYFPLLVFDGEGRLASVRLRPGNAGSNRYATPLLVRLVRKIKARFPAAMIVVRGDSSFGTARLLEALEQLDRELGDVDYVLGLQGNARLLAEVAGPLAEVAARRRHAADTTRMYTSLLYRARSWSRSRFVVAKVEQLGDKPNPRFVVTSLNHVPPQMLYENAYCGRGDAENRIKDFKRALAADRLSCTTYVANAFRLLLHAFAYRLLDAFRREVHAVMPTLGHAQFDTLRLHLLKVAAFVRQSVRRIVVALPRAFPLAALFRQLALRLATAPAAA